MDEIESRLLRALSLWERNQAPWMLLLVALLLARVALDTDQRRDEARDRLATVYAGFEEGFDTERLCDARVMLGRLTNG